MKRFPCPSCGRATYFENTQCGACGTALAFDPELLAFVPSPPAGPAPALCTNQALAVCNWNLSGSPHGRRCLACAANRTLPDLESNDSLALWKSVEQAKHRLVYGLLRFHRPALREPLVDGSLQYDFLLPQVDEPVLTGHADGLITLNLLEARDSYREKVRSHMGEPYRTLIGHLRHEIAHFYWPSLVAKNPEVLAHFRTLFGHEESPSYGDALKSYYAHGPRKNWQSGFISAYASAHPWEDWAETWAYYLHLVSAIDTAAAHGIALASETAPKQFQEMPVDPYQEIHFDTLIAPWASLSVAINSLNRSLGTRDPSPFILNPSVIEKIRFIHTTIHG